MSRKAAPTNNDKSSENRRRSRRDGSSRSGSSYCSNMPPFDLYRDDGARNAKISYQRGLEGVVRLLRDAKRIVVLTGAGISVSCGIPDFRSKGSGLYSTLDVEVRRLSYGSCYQRTTKVMALCLLSRHSGNHQQPPPPRSSDCPVLKNCSTSLSLRMILGLSIALPASSTTR
jgi:hypothetical protein